MTMAAKTTGGKGTKKAASSKTPAKNEPAPMDPDATEVPQPSVDRSAHTPHSERVCYALRTLVGEVEAVYGQFDVVYGDRTGRGVALSVTFTQAENTEPRLDELLSMIESESRVQAVMVETEKGESDEGYATDVTVLIVSDARVYDDPSPFGLVEAAAVLRGEK